MTELYSFLDGAFAEMRARMDLEYQRRVAAHTTAITTGVSPTGYTPNYGKIDVEAAFRKIHDGHCPCASYTHRRQQFNISINSGYTNPDGVWQTTRTPLAEHFAKALPSGTWIIHAICYSNCTYHDYNEHSVSLIDNYGRKHGFNVKTCKGPTCDYFSVFNDETAEVKVQTPTVKLYALTNALIDLYKSFTTDPFIGEKGSALHRLAEHEYHKAALLASLTPRPGQPDYATLKREKEQLQLLLAATKKELASTTEELEALRKEKACPLFPELLVSELAPPSPPSPLNPEILAELESILTST